MVARLKTREILEVWGEAKRRGIERPQSAMHLVQRFVDEAGGVLIGDEPTIKSILFAETQLFDGSYSQLPTFVHVHNHGVEIWSTFAANVLPERLPMVLSSATTLVREHGLAVSDADGTTILHLREWTNSLEYFDSMVLRIRLAQRADELYRNLISMQ